MDLESQKGDEESVESKERVVVISSGDSNEGSFNQMKCPVSDSGSFTEGNGSSGLINDVGLSRMLSGKGCDEREIEERFDRVDSGSGRQSGGLVDGSVLETVGGVNSENVGGGNGSSGLINDVGLSCMLSVNGCNEREIEERFDPVDSGSGQESGGLVYGSVLETVGGVNSENVGGGNEGLNVKDNEVDLRKVLAEEVAENVCKEEGSCVIDVNGYRDENSDDDSDGEVVCRICHLSADQSPKADDTSGVIASPARMDLIQLGCECKDELGIAHRQCAEAWFKLKGNRSCEICGEIAKNITFTGNSQLIENWNGRRFAADNNSGGRGRCWQGQSFCNFLMACLVIAFVFPWFFRVNMF